MLTMITKLDFHNRSDLIKFLTNLSKTWVSQGLEAREIDDKLGDIFERHREFARLISPELAKDLGVQKAEIPAVIR
jgi:hypothetical protein